MGGDEEEGEGEGEAAAGDGGGAQAAVSLADLMPKVDISGQIKAELVKELGDKNWKIRGEALQKVREGRNVVQKNLICIVHLYKCTNELYQHSPSHHHR